MKKRKQTKIGRVIKFLYNNGKKVRDGEELLIFAYKNFYGRNNYLKKQALRTILYNLQKKGIVKLEVPFTFWRKETKCFLLNLF